MVILQLSSRNSVNGVASCTSYYKRHKPYKSTSFPQECVTVTIAQITYSGNLRSKIRLWKFGPYTWLRSTSWRSVEIWQCWYPGHFTSKQTVPSHANCRLLVYNSISSQSIPCVWLDQLTLAWLGYNEYTCQIKLKFCLAAHGYQFYNCYYDCIDPLLQFHCSCLGHCKNKSVVFTTELLP